MSAHPFGRHDYIPPRRTRTRAGEWVLVAIAGALLLAAVVLAFDKSLFDLLLAGVSR